jgi:alkylation response protein AidB-like acyl-CoA dehydrogenase
MPTSAFAEEHEALRATVRRLVSERLAPLAEAAEHGAAVHIEALELAADLRELPDVLADVVVAEELGRMRSGGLVAVLLDAALLADVGCDGPGAVARDGEVRVSGDVADGELSTVVGGAVASRLLVLDAGVVVELDERCEVRPAVAPHALRGGAVADVSVRAAPCRDVAATTEARGRAELREAAAAVAGAWQTFDDAHAYAGQRAAFGRPIGAFQVNRHAIAEMATWLTAAEALVHDTAWAMASGGGAPAVDTAAARLVAGRTARHVADRCLQLHGGYGYTMDFDVQRAWRDARALVTGDAERRTRLRLRAQEGTPA